MVEFLHDESIRDEQLIPLSEQTVRILVTDADKTGHDISRIPSNKWRIYVASPRIETHMRLCVCQIGVVKTSDFKALRCKL